MSLDEIFRKTGADKGSQGHGYANTYEFIFEPFRLRPINLLEIGVFQGASIAAWLEYFSHATIYGIDCDPQVPSNGRYKFFQGRQEEAAFLYSVIEVAKTGFDIVIDDGSHMPVHQAASFKHLWPHVRSGGYYIIEDIHPWFDARHGPIYHEGAPELVWSILKAVNWSGKEYCGRPFPAEAVSPTDKEFDSLLISRGLLVLKKV